MPVLADIQGNAAALALDTKAKEEKGSDIKTYEVVDGDTAGGIAQRFGVNTQTVLWSNNLKDTDLIRPGQKLEIPPVLGVLHTVAEGETLMGIASHYSADIQAVLGSPANKLGNADDIRVGQKLVIPDGIRPPDPPKLMVASSAPPAVVAPTPPPAPAVQAAAAGGVLQWPTYGPIYTYFSGGHKGLDISPPYGTPVYSAEAGIVSSVQQTWDYGLYVIVDHGNGFTTLYAHLSQALASPGQAVGRGSAIGRVGATGRATGPHLHFEVRHGGVPVNPLNYLQ